MDIRLNAKHTALVLVAMAGATGCGRVQGNPTARTAGSIPVSVVKVRESNVPLPSTWVGTLDGFVNAQIQPQVTGYLIHQNYSEGSLVAKGQVLFQIDPRSFQAAVKQAEAQVAQAKGQLAQAQAQQELAQINLKRDTPLARDMAIAESQLDNDKQAAKQADAAVASNEASIKSFEAALDTAKLNLEFTHVRALVSGVVGQAAVQMGNLVTPSSVLTSVSQLDPIKVYFSISDAEYLALADQNHKAGSGPLGGKSGLPLTLKLVNGKIWPHKGHIIWLDRAMSQQAGAIRVAASFPNPGNVLRPGQFGQVTAAAEVRQNALLVPQLAVQELQGIDQVYIAGPDNRVHVVNVKLGQQVGNDWIVSSGLQAGQLVITSNLQKLRDGAPITPHEISNQEAIRTSSPTGVK